VTGFIDRSIKEKILLVGVEAPDRPRAACEESLEELAALVDTAGADVAGCVIKRRSRPDPSTYLGEGQVEEIYRVCEELDVDTVVFDVRLRPAQQSNLERVLKRSAIDRTAVILDIFAQHASTLEGRLQVELALLRYRMTRLRGKGLQMSRLAGGIGTRGPGETQLETDRRRIARRITKLQQDLAELAERRANQRRHRRRNRLVEVCLVGYTNAGKSSLLNALTRSSSALVEDRLFSTLDPRTRRIRIPGFGDALITDTVGFVRDLPHELVEAFHSTLEQVREADLLVHVVDCSRKDVLERMGVVRGVLAGIGAAEVPELVALNKADLDPDAAHALAAREPGAVVISCATGLGLKELLERIGSRLRSRLPGSDGTPAWLEVVPT
jgi:GTP-binding protein HflX